MQVAQATATPLFENQTKEPNEDNQPVLANEQDLIPIALLAKMLQERPEIKELLFEEPGLATNENKAPTSSLNQSPVRDSSRMTLWNKFRHQFVDGPDWFKQFRNWFTLSLNGVGISLNALAVIGKTILPKPVQEYVDEKAEWFSRYIVPVSFTWNGIEALVGHKPLEALARVLPGAAFVALPFHNFNFATGISSTLNYIFEHVADRHGGVQPGNGNMLENFKEVGKTTLSVIKDALSFNPEHEDLPKRLATLGMGIGTLGGLAFAAKSRDSFAAKLFGNMRNIGGLIADWKLVFNDVEDKSRSRDLRLVGSSCSTASILNILMRWVGPEAARMLNHIAIALDDFGLTYWAHASKKDNDKVLRQKIGLLNAA